MSTWVGRGGQRIVVALILVALMPLSALSAAETKQYISNTIRGRLFDPETDKPMVGAKLRFVAVEEGAQGGEATTGAEGQFEVAGLGFGRYAIEIETADGEVIHGVNPVKLTEDKSEVTLKISKHYRSTTEATLDRQRFVVATAHQEFNWKRFWIEFGIFFGAAIGVGLAAD